MQISKLMPAICAVAVCAGLVSARAQDNPAQAAARAALLQKMGELDAADGNPPAIIVTPSGATTEKSAPTNIETPPPAPTLPVVPAAANTAETAAQAKQDAALAKQKQADAAAAASGSAKQAAQDKAAEAKAAKLEQKKIAEAEKQRAAAEKAAVAASAGKNATFQPMPAPALPISAAKQEQLQALLGKYKADQISSAEYQTQRAAILAQP